MDPSAFGMPGRIQLLPKVELETATLTRGASPTALRPGWLCPLPDRTAEAGLSPTGKGVNPALLNGNRGSF